VVKENILPIKQTIVACWY